MSGFLISYSFERSLDLRDFYCKRAKRIYPAMLLALVFSCCMLIFFGYFNYAGWVTFFSWFLAQLSLFQFWNPEAFRGFGVGVVNGVLWTISVELWFY